MVLEDSNTPGKLKQLGEKSFIFCEISSFLSGFYFRGIFLISFGKTTIDYNYLRKKISGNCLPGALQAHNYRHKCLVLFENYSNRKVYFLISIVIKVLTRSLVLAIDKLAVQSTCIYKTFSFVSYSHGFITQLLFVDYQRQDRYYKIEFRGVFFSFDIVII